MRQTILVVDDQAAVRRLLNHMLVTEGYQVMQAEDGAWALEALRGPITPDLCVLDVMMPGVDGWEVLRSVRQDPTLADLPVVLLTAKGQPQDRLRGWELGCDAYIPKPFDPPDCLNEIHAVLARPPAERSALRRRQLTVVRSMLAGDRKAG
jgi:CheY-like chemotaxis protein